MFKQKSIIAFSLLLLGGGFFGFAGAQNIDRPFAVNNLPAIKDIYRLDGMIQNLPFVVARNTSILVKTTSSSHASADIQDPSVDVEGLISDIQNQVADTKDPIAETGRAYSIDPSKINAFLSESQGFDEFYQKIRIDIVNFLMDNGYTNFNNQPYEKGNFAVVEQSGDFKVLKNIEQNDTLDKLLKPSLSGFTADFSSLKDLSSYLNFKTIGITKEEYAKLGTLFMFKNEQDLRDLGYELISWKTRINTDPDYRRHNIMAAFSNIGNVRLIMPNETFSLAHEFHYTPSEGGISYVSGYATFGNGAKMVYGGGLCGVATAFFQGTLTNLGLSLVEYKAHSTYYKNLYEAEINGTIIKDPGLDATVYTPKFDLKVKNIREYPVIVAFDFDGSKGSIEQVLTLSKSQDRGSFEYIGSYKKSGLSCFTRKIKGKNMTNCYKAIKNFSVN